MSTTTMKYDYLVYAVGAETQTFNIPGVKEHACFMKELEDAETVRALTTPGCDAMRAEHPCRCNAGSWTVSVTFLWESENWAEMY